MGGQGGPHGDLYIEVHIKPDKRFHRDDTDLLTEHVVTIPQAVLGHRFTLETFDGAVDVDVPAGTESGELLRLRSKGMPYLRGSGRGDILVRVRVETPKKLSGKAKKLFEELADELGEPSADGKKGFFDRFKV